MNSESTTLIFVVDEDLKGERSRKEIATEETRGKLYMWMKEVITITKPKIFIAENVKGLVNLHNVKEIIQRDFSSVGENGYIEWKKRIIFCEPFHGL